MKKQLFVLLGALLLTACEVIPGNFTVNELITLNNNNEQEQFLEGNYSAEMSFRSKQELLLSIERDNGKTSNIVFRIPNGTDIPQTNGEINLSAEQVRQPYAVHGVVKTDVTLSDSQYDNESCQEQRPYTVCETDNRGRTRCYTQYQTFYGWRDVRFRLRTESKNFAINLNEEGNTLASFNGVRREGKRVYDYVGPCR